MLSHFTRSRGEPQAAFPPSPCAKSDNMSSNKKSPPQGSAESKLYKAGLRSQYTLLLPLTSAHVLATPIYHALSLLSSACRFLSDKTSPLLWHLVPQRPRAPRANGGLLSHPSITTARCSKLADRALRTPCLRRLYLARRREPVHFFGRTPSASMGDMRGLFLSDMSRGERLYFPLFGENLHRHACPP